MKCFRPTDDSDKDARKQHVGFKNQARTCPPSPSDGHQNESSNSATCHPREATHGTDAPPPIIQAPPPSITSLASVTVRGGGAVNSTTAETSQSPAVSLCTRSTENAMAVDGPVPGTSNAVRLEPIQEDTDQGRTGGPSVSLTGHSANIRPSSAFLSCPTALGSSQALTAKSVPSHRAMPLSTDLRVDISNGPASTPPMDRRDEVITLDLSKAPATQVSVTTHTPTGVAVPSAGTREEGASLPLKRMQKAIRKREECTTYYKSAGAQPFDSPSEMPQAYEYWLKVADLYVHYSQTQDTYQTWMWSGSQWTSIGEDAHHPVLSGYHLKLSDNGEPSWVTRKTMITDQGRMKKRQCL